MSQPDRSKHRIWNTLLRWFIPFDQYLEKSGDLDEGCHYLRLKKGSLHAELWYGIQTVRILKAELSERFYWRAIMLKNYLKIALRNIQRNKFYSFINIFGLAVGMTVCILITLWIRDELSYDTFHANFPDIYRLVEEQRNSDGSIFPVAVTPELAGPTFKAEYADIDDFVRFRIFANRFLVRYGEKSFYESGFCFADPSFLTLFSFPLTKGDVQSALTGMDKVVISQDIAEKYFGNEDPVGKTINLNNGIDFTVSGVLAPVPSNSHLQFQFLGHFDVMMKTFGFGGGWWNNNFYTYFQLRPGSDVERLGSELRDYLKKLSDRTSTTFYLQSLKDIHLRSNFAIDHYGQTQDKSVYIYIFSAVAVIVLLIACINFMNLATARSSKRGKEVAMRKTTGAVRSDISRQFFGESIFLAMIACISAAVMVKIFLPSFNNLSGKLLTFSFFSDIKILLFLLGIGVVSGLFSGIYPALFISSFQPVRIFKGISASGRRSVVFRKALVIVQFTLSIIFIAGTIVIYNQLTYMRNKDLGFDKENIIHFRYGGGIRQNFDAFRNEMLLSPQVKSITRSSDIPTYTVHSTTGFNWEGQNPEDRFLIHQFSVDHDYIKTFGMEIIDGRDLSREFPVDAKTQSFILNEAAIRQMGIESPVGKRFSLYDNQGTIVGIVRDFHFKSMHEKIEPLVLRIDSRRDGYVFVRLAAGNISKAVAAVQGIYDKFNPQFPFEFSFLDESLNELYQSDERTGKIFNSFTVLAILISCLGLFGLASYMIEQRTKEIGIRKVLGAGFPRIVFLLSREFMKWIILSQIIAIPVTYLIMRKWLEGFAYKTSIHPLVFIISGGLALVIAAGTVSFQSIRAAVSDPVKCIRYE